MSPPAAAPARPQTAARAAAGAVPPPARRVLVVAQKAAGEATAQTLQGLGYAAETAEDAYAAVARLAAERGGFGLLVVSLAALFDEELPLIAAVKRRLGPVEVAVCDVDGRAARFAEAMRLGADALLAGGFLHRLSPPAPAERPPEPADVDVPRTPPEPDDSSDPDPALTPAELRALLGDD